MKYLISLSSLMGMSMIWMTSMYNMPSMTLSISMVWLVLGTVLISSISSNKKMALMWFFFLNILVFSFLVNTLFSFYILFEFSLIPILLMIIYWGNQPERLSSGLYFLIYTSMMSIPFLILMLWSNKSFFSLYFYESSNLMNLILLAPFLVKMPVFGLHYWLPKAHVEASTSGSMVLAGILLKLGGYGIFRLIMMFNILMINTTYFWLISSVFSSVLTIMQSDIKKLVAYSSVTHMTFMVMGMSLFVKSSLMILVMLSLAHGWASMGMFMSAGMFSHASNSRLGLLIMSESKFHWSTLLSGVMLVSNSSLPPFPSFFPELYIVVSLSYLSLFIFIFITLSLMVCYYNTYFYMMLSHWSSTENKLGMFSQSEMMKLYYLITWTFISLKWLIILS